MKLLLFSLLFFVLIIFPLFPNGINTFYYKSDKEILSHSSNLNLGFIILPRDIFEDAFSQIPQLSYKASILMMPDFYFNYSLSSIIFSNQATVGALYDIDISGIKIAPQVEGGMWYGFYTGDNVDLVSFGFVLFPAISISYSFDEIYFTAKSKLLLQSQKSMAGDNELGRTYRGLTGYSFSIIAEKEFIKNTFLTFEVDFTFTKFHNLTWLSYSTFDAYMFYPSINIGINL